MTSRPPNFDPIARAYRWLEYLSLGPLLERTRRFYLTRGVLDDRRQALILGDGDGRFTHWLLARNPRMQATAIDLSARMLALLQHRCRHAAGRLTVRLIDARAFRPAPDPGLAACDLVVTHFFLDCLTQPELEALATGLRPSLAPNCLWLVSEFRIPAGWLGPPAALFIRSLYYVFRILTGLRITRLPDHAAALRACGFILVGERHFLAGILTAQLWALSSSVGRVHSGAL